MKVSNDTDSRFVLSADVFEEARNFRLLELEQEKMVFSASAQYSLAGLHGIHAVASKRGAVHIINLREEPHFMINGYAVSLYKGSHNDANKGLSLEQITEKQQLLISQLRNTESIPVFIKKKIKDPITKEKKLLHPRDEKLDIEAVHSEGECATTVGAHYTHIPVTDHDGRAVINHIDSIVKAVLHSKKEGHSWIHFHCHEGKGRAPLGLLIGLFTLLSKSKSLSEIETILSRPEMKAEYRKFTQYKILFGHFHNYCRESDLTQSSWKRWAEERQILISTLEKVTNKPNKLQAKL